jgi:excisionase family DNA binding protein
MNKKEAAQFLGVTERSLERYVSQNKLKVTYAKGKTRPIAIFDSNDLERLKREMESMPMSMRPGTLDLNGDKNLTSTNGDNNANTEIASKIGEGNQKTDALVASNNRASSAPGLTKREKTEDLIKIDKNKVEFPIASLNGSGPLAKIFRSVLANNKIILTLSEASAISSLSQQELRKAIHAGQLLAGRKGRGWKIRRKDLESYIEKLW